MKLPAGFTVPGRTITEQDRKDYVLKLEKNLYGQKTGRKSMVPTSEKEPVETWIQTKPA